MPQRNYLLHQLEELEARQVISQETAERIREYYRNKSSGNRSFSAVIIILGSILIASGIVLVAAHNWDEFSPTVRTMFALLPLAISQFLCLYVLYRKPDINLWKESAAIFLFFSVVTCISIISQIYNISGSLSGFLQTWILLCLPLVYIMRTLVVMIFLIAAVTLYAILIGYGMDAFSAGKPAIPFLYLAVVILMIPFYLQLRKRKDARIPVVHFVFCISVCIALGAFNNGADVPKLIFIAYINLLHLLYMLHYFFGERNVFKNPFLFSGISGIIILLYIFSFGWIWEFIHDKPVLTGELLYSPLAWFSILTPVLSYLVIRSSQEKYVIKTDPLIFSPYLFVLIVLVPMHPDVSQLLINLLIFSLAIYYIRLGSVRNHLGILNAGLLIITILALLRFFDTDIPFLWRGAFFVSAGILLFTANYLFLKRRKGIHQTQEK